MAKEKKGSALMREVQISDELAAIVGPGPMPRTVVTSKLWEYIKKKQLQDTKEKRMINPDAALSKVVGNKKIDMFQMTKKVNEHIKAPAAARR